MTKLSLISFILILRYYFATKYKNIFKTLSFLLQAIIYCLPFRTPHKKVTWMFLVLWCDGFDLSCLCCWCIRILSFYGNWLWLMWTYLFLQLTINASFYLSRNWTCSCLWWIVFWREPSYFCSGCNPCYFAIK
jgi:hypothetical protein